MEFHKAKYNNFLFNSFKKGIGFFFYFIFFSSIVFPQQKKNGSIKTITSEFAFNEITFTDISIVTNVLKVKNNNGKSYTFTVDINLPTGWRSMVNTEKEYILKPNDSIYIPVRIITSNKRSKGGTKYSISAYINTNEGKQMAFARFIAGRPKITNWQMHILPRPRIYFLNGENTSAFQLHVTNDGDENQDIVITMQKIGKELVVKDSANKILKKNYLELSLPPYQDTLIDFNVNINELQRNQERVDVWSPMHFGVQKERRFGLFIRGSEIGMQKSDASLKTKKAEFVKLANSIDFVKLNNSTVAGNGTNTLPLSVFFNVNNIIGQQPVALLNMFGNAEIGKYSSINYNMQTSWLYYKYSKEFFTDRLSGNIAYTYKRFFMAWASGGGFGGSNGTFRSLSLGYSFPKGHFLSASISRNSFIRRTPTGLYGLNYAFASNYLRINTNIVATIFNNKIFTYAISTNLGLPLIKKFPVSIFATYGKNFINLPNQSTSFSFGSGIGYNIKRFSHNLFFTYFTSALGANPLFQRSSLFLNQVFSYNFRKGARVNLTTQLASESFLNTSFFNSSNISFLNLINIVTVPKKKKAFRVTPLFFANFYKFLSDTLAQYGTQLNISQTNFENKVFLGGNIRAGYNSLLSFRKYGAAFNMQVNVFARYKVWNIIGIYSYGPFGTLEAAKILKEGTNVYPQIFRISVGHQYQFKNKRFVWENAPVYTYLNALKRNGLSWNSQLYYFTKNLYRFNINFNYNINSGYGFKYAYQGLSNLTPQLDDQTKKVVSQNLLIGFNIKKDFSIPIPKRFRNNKFCDATFIVFLDVNGDGKMQEGEVPVENVVLRMNEHEVITDEMGKASYINMSFAKYRLQVFPLVDMGSWFPNISDSLEICGPIPVYIPFTKGVQVYGLVDLDREAYTGQIFEKLDVSRFKIYLVDSAGKVFSSITDNKGNFSFYVPFAKYTLKFDERALGSSFYLPENDIELDLRNGIESYYHHFLIIEKKRKVKKKIFGPDGKVTYVEEDATSMKKDKNESDVSKDADKGKGTSDKKDDKSKQGRSSNQDGRDGEDGLITYEAKFRQLDSLLEVLNKLIMRAATKPDVRFIVHEEMQLLMDELNTTFTIQIEQLAKGKKPTGILLQLVRMKKVEELKLANGSTIYFSGEYRNVQEAEKFCRDFQTSGFRNSKVAKRKSLLKLK
jgi:hypothetical protein